MSTRTLVLLLFFGAFGPALAFRVQAAESNRMDMPPMSMDTNQSLQHMAESMTSMSEMCKMMMQMEMKSHPLKVAAFAAGGTLLSIALILLIILELQWIRYFSLRIRSEKTRPQMP